MESETSSTPQFDPAATFFQQGERQRLAGNFEAAIKYYDQAIELKPEYLDALILRGYALYQLERYDESIAACDRVLEINEDSDTAWNVKGYAIQRKGMVNKFPFNWFPQRVGTYSRI